MIDMDSCQTLTQLWEARVENTPNHEFLVFESVSGAVESYTYEQFNELVAQARGYFASKGVGRSDRVIIAAHNCPESVVSLLALSSMGAVLVAVNPCCSKSDILHYCKIVTPCLFLALSPLSSDAQEALDEGMPSVKNVVLRNDSEGLFDGFPPLESVPSNPMDLLEIIFTSGTTSLPKGVSITQSNAIHAAKTNAMSYSLRQTDRFLVTVPLFHVDAPYAAIVPSVLVGSVVVLMEKYSASHCISQCRKHKATLAHCVAMMIKTMMLQPADMNDKNHDLRMVSFFMRLTKEERDAFSERFGVRLMNSYGLSESITSVTMDRTAGPEDFDSVGEPTNPYEIRIVTSDGEDALAGEVGEIWIRGIPGVTIMSGYYGNERATRDTIVGEQWLKSGDLGAYDEQGGIQFRDRIKNIIKCKGENVSAAEVEECIKSMTGVQDVSVVGVPDPICGECVLAIVCPTPAASIDEDAVLQYCKENLSLYKVPTRIILVDALPLTATGKVDRKLLQSRYRNTF